MSVENPWLLATDMDGTVIPLEDTPAHRAAVERFREVVEARDDLLLAYVTGRDLGLVGEGIRTFGLPRPDLVAADVGTTVYRWDGGTFQEDPEYRHLMREAMGGLTATGVGELLSDCTELEAQPPERQGTFKRSYFTPRSAVRDGLVDRVRRRLEDRGARVNLIFSVDSVRGIGLLDILPAGVAKDAAVRFLHDRTGVSEEHLIYAGDSGNDRAAMLAGYRVVVVGNAPRALKDALRTEGARAGVGGSLYFAREPYAAGVLEGMRHWGLEE